MNIDEIQDWAESELKQAKSYTPQFENDYLGMQLRVFNAGYKAAMELILEKIKGLNNG